jgi:NTP pyrophosphatase (non-canonical NTP hydrolase)
MGLTDIEKAALYDIVRPEVRKMSMRMEEKFRLNDKERGNPFACDDEQFMLERLADEKDEFHDAIDNGDHYSKVWNEAADVCNFITMLCVNYEREWLASRKERR